MKKLDSRPGSLDCKYLIVAFLVVVVGLIACFVTNNLERNSYEDIQSNAAMKMQEAEKVLKSEILALGIEIELEDLNTTGLIGPEFTELTTTPGSVDAKRTSLNPNFAAAMIRYFYDAGLKKGDTIAIGTSGSFPGFVLASTIAATEMGLKTKVIASCGSSMHGATRVEFNIFDILFSLKKNGFADFDLLGVSGGGENDQGGGVLEGILYENTNALSLNLCLEAAEESGAEVLNFTKLSDNIERRLELYGDTVDMFINIGGAAPNSGTSSYTLNFPRGLVLVPPAIPNVNDRGLCYEFASQGIPVLNLLNVKQLAAENGIAYDSVPMEKPGKGLVYTTSDYSTSIILVTLVCALGILGIGVLRKNNGRSIFRFEIKAIHIQLAIKILILTTAIIIAIFAGKEFYSLRYAYDSFVASENLTKVTSLSAYEPSLAGSRGDSPIYIFDSGVEGGTVLVVGGTHPNESAGILSSYILMENLEISKGRIIVLPIGNYSAATTGLSGFGYPSSYSLETPWGQKMFRVGSRLANPLDQWPDPPIFTQYPFGTRLCYEDTRNLNRNYPGRSEGTLIEKVGSAIMKLIQQENVNFAFDLHEASITYPTNNALIVPEKSADITFLSSLLLAEEGVNINVAISGKALQGLSHQEWGRNEGTFPFLIEVPTPFIDRITGPMTEALITEGRDEFLIKMSDLGFTTINYDEEGFSLAYRCALHLSSMAKVVSVGSMMFPEYEVIASWPGFIDIIQNGIGSYLHDPLDASNAERVQMVAVTGN